VAPGRPRAGRRAGPELAPIATLAETHREAIEGARPRVERYIEVFGEAVGSWASHEATQYASYGKMVESIARTTIESMLRDRQALIGTPEEVVEQLRYHREVFGSSSPRYRSIWRNRPRGGVAHARALRTAASMPKLQG